MKQKFFALAVMMLTLIFSSVTFAGYWKVADNQVPAYRDSNLTQRTGNEAVYKGDRIYVHQEQGRAYEVSYPVGNSGKYKKRWVSKAVFNLTAPTRPIQPVTRPATNKYARISGDFYLVVDNGGRHVVDVPFNSHNAGTFLQIYSKNDGAAQKFTIKPVSGEWHSITHKDSGLVMNVYYGRPDNGNKVWLYQYDGTPASLWRFRDLGNEIYNIESQLSGNPFLEVQSNNPFDGAVLQLWQQHTGQAARWKLVKAGATNKANFQFANYSLTSPANYQLRFTGNLWDANNQSAITGVHVYIGGGAGGGGDFLGQFQANGSNHSFNTTLNVPQNRSGNQLVVIYAVNGTESKELDRRNINIAPSSSGDKVSEHLNRIINDWDARNKTKKWTGSGECFGFANYVFEQLHGITAGSYKKGATLGSVSSGVKHLFLTYDAVIDKNAVDDVFRNKAKPGDFVKSSRPHSMIFVQYDTNNKVIWVLDANWHNPHDNIVRYHSFTLDAFAKAFKEFSIYTK